MQNKQLKRLCMMIILSLSLTACDQLMSQMNAMIDTNNVHDCSNENACKAKNTDDPQFNWFLKEVKKQ